MTRVMFDTNAYDAIMAHGDVGKIIASELHIITTHIQEDELRQIKDNQKREALLKVYFQISRKPVSTSVAVWGVSKWGQSNWTGDQARQSFSAIQRNRPVASRDEIIGTTAKDQCDLFVTEDGKFATRLSAAAPNLRVLNYADFRQEFLT